MELTKAFQSNTTLQEIKMYNCDLSDDDISQIIEALATPCTVHTLNLSLNNCGGQSLQALARMLSNPKCQLRSLDLSDQNSRELILENLVLLDNDNDGGRGGQQRDYSNKSLQQLDLSNNQMLDDNMLSINLLLQQLTGLQEINLRFNNISDRGLALLAQNRVPSTLRNPSTEEK